MIPFHQPEKKIIVLKDENDTKDMKDTLQKNDRVIVKGELPGTGKTTAIKNSGYKVLFVTPYNKSCQELRKDETKLQNYTEQIANINILGEYTKKAKRPKRSVYLWTPSRPSQGPPPCIDTDWTSQLW